MFVCLSVGSLVTPNPRLVAGICLTVAAIIIVVTVIIIVIIIIIAIIIIIIILVGKPSRTKDLLGLSFLIHAETSK